MSNESLIIHYCIVIVIAIIIVIIGICHKNKKEFHDVAVGIGLLLTGMAAIFGAISAVDILDVRPKLDGLEKANNELEEGNKKLSLEKRRSQRINLEMKAKLRTLGGDEEAYSSDRGVDVEAVLQEIPSSKHESREVLFNAYIPQEDKEMILNQWKSGKASREQINTIIESKIRYNMNESEK